MESIEGLTHQSITALAFMLWWLFGGFMAYLVLDGTFYLLGGHTWTGSHAVYVLNLHYHWIKYMFVGLCLVNTAFWTWHFFS